MPAVLATLGAFSVIILCGARAEGAVRSDPDSAEAYVVKAREAGGEDRHVEAIAFFIKACRFDSTLTAEVGKEIGFQLTWNDEPVRALPWFRTYLERHPEDDEALLGYARALSWADSLEASLRVYRSVRARSPENLDARLGEAQVVAWAGDAGDAEMLYRDILSAEPGNLDARLGLAQVMNGRGRHREARELYADILREYPDNRQAIIGVAATEHWLGRDDKARRRLIGITAEKEAREILAEIDREEAPSVRIDYGISRDSDELVIHRFEAGGTIFLGDLTSVGISASRYSMRQDSRPRIVAHTVTASLYRRLSEDWAIHLNATPVWSSYDVETPDSSLGLNPGSQSFNPFTWNGWVTWTPQWRLRVDVSGERGVIETPLSFIREIAFDGVGAGADVAATERVVLRGGYDFRSYSDGNKRNGWNTEVAFLVLRKPLTFSIAPGYTGFTFSEWRPNGYYNPSRYDNLGLSLTVEASLGGRTRLASNGRVSAEREAGGDFFAVGAFNVSLEADVVARSTIGGEFFASNSRIAGEAGYNRTLGNLYVIFRF